MWVAGWVFVGFCWKFDLQWVGVGCCGFVGWVVAVGCRLVSGVASFFNLGEIFSMKKFMEGNLS